MDSITYHATLNTNFNHTILYTYTGKTKVTDTTDNSLDNCKKNRPLKAIRQKCLDCCVYKPSEVRRCHITSCPLWPYRMGKNPFHKRTMTEKQKQEASKRLKVRNSSVKKHLLAENLFLTADQSLHNE